MIAASSGILLGIGSINDPEATPMATFATCEFRTYTILFIGKQKQLTSCGNIESIQKGQLYRRT